MKKAVLTVVLLTLVIGVGGCNDSAKRDRCRSKCPIRQPEPDSTIAEINAVRMLSSESARLNILTAIAARPGLSPQARIHLVQTTRFLSSESAREQVLLTLANNSLEVLKPKILIEQGQERPVSVTAAEIEAVRNLNTNSSREKAYMALASNPALSPHARAELSNAIQNLNTNSSREKVLLTLAGNDCPLSKVGVTIAEINAVLNLNTNASRLNVYLRQAQNPYLSEKARGHLAKEATTKLNTNDSRQQVLMALGNAQTTPQP